MTTRPDDSDDPDGWDDSGAADVVDARGLRCPIPIIRIAAAAKGLPAGTELVLLSTDPAARPDVAAWCRMRGHELLAQTDQDDAGGTPMLRSRVRLR